MCPIAAWLVGGRSSMMVDIRWWYILSLRLSSVSVPWLHGLKPELSTSLHCTIFLWNVTLKFSKVDEIQGWICLYSNRFCTKLTGDIATGKGMNGCPNLFASTYNAMYLVCWLVPALNQSSISPFDLKHSRKYVSVTKTSVSFDRINKRLSALLTKSIQWGMIRTSASSRLESRLGCILSSPFVMNSVVTATLTPTI